jgi:cytochrome c553
MAVYLSKRCVRLASPAIIFFGAVLVAMSAAVADPLPHVVPDTLAQRLQACTACHGKEGVATNQGYFPRIAGKPAGYLYNQLLNFREGRRHNATMNSLVENMSDAYLREIAQHFADLELPYPEPAASTARQEELARGELLVTTGDARLHLPACTECHGQAMTGVAPSIPGLLGVSRDYIVSQFGAWRSGERHAAAPDCMATLGQRLTVEDIGAVASYLAARKLPGDARAAPASRVPASAPLPIECGSVSR